MTRGKTGLLPGLVSRPESTLRPNVDTSAQYYQLKYILNIYKGKSSFEILLPSQNNYKSISHLHRLIDSLDKATGLCGRRDSICREREKERTWERNRPVCGTLHPPHGSRSSLPPAALVLFWLVLALFSFHICHTVLLRKFDYTFLQYARARSHTRTPGFWIITAMLCHIGLISF